MKYYITKEQAQVLLLALCRWNSILLGGPRQCFLTVQPHYERMDTALLSWGPGVSLALGL